MRKYGRIQEETKKTYMMSAEKFGRYKTQVEGTTKRRETLALY